jgi:hypothetical protein
MREGTLSSHRTIPTILVATAMFWTGGLDNTADPREEAKAPLPVIERVDEKSGVPTIKPWERPTGPVRQSPGRQRKHDQLRLMQRLPPLWLA